MREIRTALVLLPCFLAAQLAIAVGQVGKESSRDGKARPKLKVGDPAPTLRATRWLQGSEVKTFEPGRVYVIEFWATWCGPCIAYMPRLSELHHRYKDDGVTIIGFSAGDADNSEDKATAFVRRRGPDLGYTFAFASDRVTFDAWMKAAGRSGIPCTFVVDKTGRIAYIGHPMYLDMVLPKVVAGASNARAIGDEMAKVQGEFGAISGTIARDPRAGLKALQSFEAKYALLTDFVPSIRMKLSYLPKYGKPGEAKGYAEALIDKAVRKKDLLTLGMVSSILRLGDGKNSAELLAVALTAAQAHVRIDGGTDAGSLIDLADAHALCGNQLKSKEYAHMALEALDGASPSFKQAIEKEAHKLGVEK